MKSAQVQKVDYRRVEPHRAKQVVEPEYWPEELRWIVRRFLQDVDHLTAPDQSTVGVSGLHARYVSPRFYVVQGDQFLLTSPGEAGWKYYIAPKLKELVGA